ncbi:MAG: alanine racemase [Acidimicrobiia bacterium]
MFGDLVTPAALVDMDVFAANTGQGVQRAAELGVDLRPHAKTVKSPELLGSVVAAGASGLTVSTLAELRTLAAVSTDIMYAVPVAAGKSPALLEALGDAPIRLTVVVDSVSGLLGVPSDPRVDVAIEIDCDGHRGGVRPDDPRVYSLADQIVEHHRLRGVMTHGGGSYLVGASEVPMLATAERDAVVGVAAGLRDRGHDVDLVSVGSTPTFFGVDHLRGASEARPGVYLFGDLSMVSLGVMRPTELALSTLATVVGVVDRGHRALIDAGWSALSQDRGVPALKGMTGLGSVTTAGLADSELIVSEANQEHGFVTMRTGGPTGLEVGERVRVWPNHACATAEMHSRLALVRGEEVIGRAERPRGWGP